MQARVLQHEVTGAGDPIVLVPGILSGWVSWIPHAERLSKTKKVIRVQPIHSELANRGELPPPSFDWRTERESLRVTLDELGIERADLVGWSGGGRALIEFSAEYPARVRTLTLVEPAAYWVLERSDRRADLPRWDMELSERLAGRAVSEDDLIEFLRVAGMGAEGVDFRTLPPWPLWLQNRNALASDKILAWPERTLEDLRSFDRPVLSVYGDATEPWLRAVAELLGEVYPKCRVLELPGNHACHIQSIDLFMKELEAHLHADG
jgi:pimeloyl-ACP methyl ester carboxylesterase